MSKFSPSPLVRSRSTQQLPFSFLYIKNDKRRRIQPPDENESVVVFTQSPRDELFYHLSGDPNVPLTPLENDSIRKVIQEHQETCREKYPFEFGSGVSSVDYNFPLSWLCFRQATSDVVELAYNAHPLAIYPVGLATRWLPLHYACRAASLEVVKF
jgi:hypothetical protein